MSSHVPMQWFLSRIGIAWAPKMGDPQNMLARKISARKKFRREKVFGEKKFSETCPPDGSPKTRGTTCHWNREFWAVRSCPLFHQIYLTAVLGSKCADLVTPPLSFQLMLADWVFGEPSGGQVSENFFSPIFFLAAHRSGGRTRKLSRPGLLVEYHDMSHPCSNKVC